MADERIIPDIDGDPQESGRRNRAALRYIHQCGFLRMEPSKHHIEAILMGLEPGDEAYKDFERRADIELGSAYIRGYDDGEEDGRHGQAVNGRENPFTGEAF